MKPLGLSMKKGRWAIVVAGLACAACAGASEEKGRGAPPAVAAAPAGRPGGAGSPPSADPTPPVDPESAAPARAGDGLEMLSVLSVEHEVDLLAQRDGVVQEVRRDQGSAVAKGDVLGRLDSRDLLVERDRARAGLEIAENNARYNEAELKAKQAAYRRARELHGLGLLSQADLEKAEFEAKGAEYDLDSWRANIKRTAAEIRKLSLDLEKTAIRAPFAGVVARRYIRSGQNVLKDEKCFRVSQLGPLQVRFLVPETSARRPRTGDAVDVVAVSDGERPHAAAIRKVSPVVDAASGGIEVMAELSDAGAEELRPGMAVRIRWASPRPAPPPR